MLTTHCSTSRRTSRTGMRICRLVAALVVIGCCVMPSMASAWTFSAHPYAGDPYDNAWRYSASDEFNSGQVEKHVRNWMPMMDACARDSALCNNDDTTPHYWGAEQTIYFSGLHKTCIHIDKIKYDYYTYGSFPLTGGPINLVTQSSHVYYSGNAFSAQRPDNSGWAYVGSEQFRPSTWFCAAQANEIVDIQHTVWQITGGLPTETDVVHTSHTETDIFGP
jgi:hypothetical protein